MLWSRHAGERVPVDGAAWSWFLGGMIRGMIRGYDSDKSNLTPLHKFWPLKKIKKRNAHIYIYTTYIKVNGKKHCPFWMTLRRSQPTTSLAIESMSLKVRQMYNLSLMVWTRRFDHCQSSKNGVMATNLNGSIYSSTERFGNLTWEWRQLQPWLHCLVFLKVVANSIFGSIFRMQTDSNFNASLDCVQLASASHIIPNINVVPNTPDIRVVKW